MENQLKEVLFVLLDEFADWEFASLACALNEEPDGTPRKYMVRTVSLTKEPLKSIGGLTVIPDYGITDVKNDFAGLILIGGNSWRNHDSQAVMALVQKAINDNIVLGGICDASFFLAKNGILNNVKHTSNELADLQANAGEYYTGTANYQMQQAVTDKKIITANGSAYLEFAKEVLLALEAVPEKEIEEWYDFFKLGYYDAIQKHA